MGKLFWPWLPILHVTQCDSFLAQLSEFISLLEDGVLSPHSNQFVALTVS